MRSVLLILTFSSLVFADGKVNKTSERVFRLSDDRMEECLSPTVYESTNPLGPIVECSLLPIEFIDCEDPVLHNGNGPLPQNSTMIAGYGIVSNDGKCTRMGDMRAEDVEMTQVKCRVLPCIECRGSRTFGRVVPCIKYTGHYFLSTLLYSIFLGVVAVDRFCLGYSAMAVGKLMTLGGFGIWWIVDIFLLVFGVLVPADESSWEPNY